MIHDLPSQTTLATNIAAVQSNIVQAAERAGRRADEVTLVAVSKTKPVELIKLAYDLGLHDFGENRVQDALPKIAEFRHAGLQPVTWHMIGHLQRNKVNKVVGSFESVQSVDSLQLAQALNAHAAELEVRIAVLLQVNVSGEASKEGMTPEEAPTLAQQIVTLPQLDVQGLMTIAPLVQNPEEVRPVFRALRELRDSLRKQVPKSTWHHLSMGMTDDYCIAIEEGATIVRVGRAIFGERARVSQATLLGRQFHET
ncbi:MAG: YggS family pyridoxal phosphate-dependent enzyme [Ktedonobacteraceae bacterium]